MPLAFSCQKGIVFDDCSRGRVVARAVSATLTGPDGGAPHLGVEACDAAMLDALLGSAPMGFAFIDTGIRLRRVSACLAELIGVKPGEQIGHTPAQAWPAALAACAEAAVRRVLASGVPLTDE